MRPPETAPKHKPILLDVGLPWLVVGHWNEPSDKWVYANLQSDLYDGLWIDTYFENEYEDKILGWLPMPEKPNK